MQYWFNVTYREKAFFNKIDKNILLKMSMETMVPNKKDDPKDMKRTKDYD